MSSAPTSGAGDQRVVARPIADAAGARATLTGLLVVVALAVVLIMPAFACLLWLTQTERWSRT